MPSIDIGHATSETLTNELTVGSSLASENIVSNPMVSGLDDRIEDAEVQRCPDTCSLPVLRSMISAWRQMVWTLDKGLSWRDELDARSCTWCQRASLPPASRH